MINMIKKFRTSEKIQRDASAIELCALILRFSFKKSIFDQVMNSTSRLTRCPVAQNTNIKLVVQISWLLCTT